MKRAAAFTYSLALVLPFVAQSAWASCGTVEVSKGDVKIFSAQTKQLAPAAAGAKICSGDTITSGADSRAKVKMEDGNELNISPDSKIVLESYQFNPAQNKKKVLLNILQGKVRATTQRENMYNDKATDGDNNTFQVKTKSAVAGVRGTDFLTGYDSKSGKSEVVTFRGKVDFGQPGPGGSIQNAVHVGAGQKTEAAAGQAPAPPHAVPAKELEKANHESKADAGGNAAKNGAPGSANGGKGGNGTANASNGNGGSGSAGGGAAGAVGSAAGGAAGVGAGGASAGGAPAGSDSSGGSNGGSAGAGSSSSGANSGANSGGSTAAAGNSAGAATGASSSGGPAPASVGGPGVAAPAAVAPVPTTSMVDLKDIGGNAGVSGPSGPSVTPIISVPPVVAPAAPQPVVCIPCQLAQQNANSGPTKVNIKVNLPH